MSRITMLAAECGRLWDEAMDVDSRTDVDFDVRSAAENDIHARRELLESEIIARRAEGAEDALVQVVLAMGYHDVADTCDPSCEGYAHLRAKARAALVQAINGLERASGKTREVLGVTYMAERRFDECPPGTGSNVKRAA